jgi:four helix bundle protein
MLQDLIIFQKIYDLILWIFPLINKFPQKQRFVLGQQLENTMLEILKGIIQANQERNKLDILKQVSIDLDKFRILYRLAKDLRFMSVRQYQFGAEKINEVGKILGGWMKNYRQGVELRLFK